MAATSDQSLLKKACRTPSYCHDLDLPVYIHDSSRAEVSLGGRKLFRALTLAIAILATVSTGRLAQQNPDEGKLVRLVCVGASMLFRPKGLVVIADQLDEERAEEFRSTDEGFGLRRAWGNTKFQDASWFLPGNANLEVDSQDPYQYFLTEHHYFTLNVFNDAPFDRFVEDFRDVSDERKDGKRRWDYFSRFRPDVKDAAAELMTQTPANFYLVEGQAAVDISGIADFRVGLENGTLWLYATLSETDNALEQPKSSFFDEGEAFSENVFCTAFGR